MKKRNLFLTLGLALTLGAGVAGGLSVNRGEAKEVEAATTSIYCIGTGYTYAHSWYKPAEGADQHATTWPGDLMTEVSDGVYKVDLDLSIKNRIIFHDNNGNQTEDLIIDSGHVYYQKALSIWSDTQNVASGYYLVGDQTNWNISVADKMSYNSDEKIAFLRSKSFTAANAGNIEMKAIYNSGSALTWYNPSKASQHDLVIPGSGNVWSYSNVGIYFGAAGTVVTDLAAKISDGNAEYDFAKPCDVSVTIGERVVAMENSITNFDEYTAKVTSAVANTSLSIEGKTIVVNDKTSNNLTSDKKVKVGGDLSVYYNKNDNKTWVSGYAPASTKLQDFCDALLALSCDAKDLTSCGWSGLSNAEKEAFNSAVVTLGDDVPYSTYGNVVNEAATRYALLIAKGATPLSGVTIASAHAISSYTNNNGSMNAVIILVSAISLVAAGSFFVIRRRKEQE